jgi:hypothetical protein
MASTYAHEIDFMALFITPVIQAPRLQTRVQLVKNIVFPETTQVVRPWLLPTSEIADESGVKSIHLRRRDDLDRLSSREGTHDMHDVSRLEDC